MSPAGSTTQCSPDAGRCIDEALGHAVVDAIGREGPRCTARGSDRWVLARAAQGEQDRRLRRAAGIRPRPKRISRRALADRDRRLRPCCPCSGARGGASEPSWCHGVGAGATITSHREQLDLVHRLGSERNSLSLTSPLRTVSIAVIVSALPRPWLPRPPSPRAGEWSRMNGPVDAHVEPWLVALDRAGRWRAARPSLALWAWERAEGPRLARAGRRGSRSPGRTVRLGRGGADLRPRLQPLARYRPAFSASRWCASSRRPRARRSRDRRRRAPRRTASRPSRSRPRWPGSRSTSTPARAAGLLPQLLISLRRATPGKGLTITALRRGVSGILDRGTANRRGGAGAVPPRARARCDAAPAGGAGGDFALAVCRRSAGLSTDEPWPALPSPAALSLPSAGVDP